MLIDSFILFFFYYQNDEDDKKLKTHKKEKKMSRKCYKEYIYILYNRPFSRNESIRTGEEISLLAEINISKKQ